MDIQRSILIVALAVVSYLLVLQWNKDYGQPELPAASASMNTTQGLPDTPSASGTSSDVPTAQSSAAGSEAADKPVAVSDKLIQVKTDVLDLAIDPRGGDIVQLGLLQYPRRLDRPDVPFPLFDNGRERTYLAQSGLTGADGPDASSAGRPLFHSAQSSYQLADGQNELVVDLSFSHDGVNYIKRFTFHRGLKADCSDKEKAQKKIECINENAYQVGVSYLIDNQSGKTWSGNLFAQLKRDGSADPSSTTATGVSTYLGAAVWTPDSPYKKISTKDMDKEQFKESVQGGWVAWLQHYFVTAWVPTKGEQHQVMTRKDGQGNYIVGFTGPTLSVPAGSKVETDLTLYAGPKLQKHLKELSPGLELTVDYGFLWFIAQPIFW
ncbi:membrane protein insertase YidC, partial [Pseudomonas aeruginosa]|nr:membrane protein insertase YidC [Pseudomonas aeruginosa]